MRCASTTICGRWPRAGDKVPRPNVLLPAYTAARPAVPRRSRAGAIGEKLRVRGLAERRLRPADRGARRRDPARRRGPGEGADLPRRQSDDGLARPAPHPAAMEKLELLVTFDAEMSRDRRAGRLRDRAEADARDTGHDPARRGAEVLHASASASRALGAIHARASSSRRRGQRPDRGMAVLPRAWRSGWASSSSWSASTAGAPMSRARRYFMPIDHDDPPTTEEIYADLTQHRADPARGGQAPPQRPRVRRDRRARAAARAGQHRSTPARRSLNDARAARGPRGGLRALRRDAERPFLLVPRRVQQLPQLERPLAAT